jgi:hypothetical protein
MLREGWAAAACLPTCLPACKLVLILVLVLVLVLVLLVMPVAHGCCADHHAAAHQAALATSG